MSDISDISNGAKKYLGYTIVKIILFLVFILFFYDIIVKICIFFGINETLVYMYSGWIIFLFLLIIILPFDNGLITSYTSITPASS